MGAVIPVRLDDEDIKRIDRLVKRQSYKSRNEAIRKMLKEKLSEAEAGEDVEDEEVERLVQVMLKMKRSGKEPVVLEFDKPIVDIVAEGRDRWPST